MQPKNPYKVFWVAAILAALLALPVVGMAKEAIQEWEFVNPSGTIAIQPIKPAPRLASLEGKTIVLRWNSAKVIKLYEVDKSTIKTSSSNQESQRIANIIKSLKADLVIGSQAD